MQSQRKEHKTYHVGCESRSISDEDTIPIGWQISCRWGLTAICTGAAVGLWLRKAANTAVFYTI